MIVLEVKGMWWMMSNEGGHYCSKKSDDICGDLCGQVCKPFLIDFVLIFCVAVFPFCLVNRLVIWLLVWVLMRGICGCVWCFLGKCGRETSFRCFGSRMNRGYELGYV